MAKLKIIKMIPEGGGEPKYVSADTKLSKATRRWVTSITEAGRFSAVEAEKAVILQRKVSNRGTYLLIDPPEV